MSILMWEKKVFQVFFWLKLDSCFMTEYKAFTLKAEGGFIHSGALSHKINHSDMFCSTLSKSLMASRGFTIA